MPGMEEILEGVVHWAAVHPNTGLLSHSELLVDSGTLIDPMLPDDGLDRFNEHPPQRALLTNRHHLRGAEAFAERFGCPILCHPDGLHAFAGGGPRVEPMRPGETPAPGVTVLELGALTPEEVALHVATGPGALALGDSVIRGRDGELGFFSDALLGDDPEAVKRGIRAGLRRILDEWEFDALLLAHGAPRVSGGRAELEAFAAG
jgi:hypothetical protein